MRTLALSLAALLALGCVKVGAPTPTLIARRTGGVLRQTAFVSPFSYEWFVRGELAMATSDARRAVEAYRLALGGPSEDVLVLARLAEALDLSSQESDADATIARAEARDACSEAVWLARAAIEARRGRSEAAITAALEAQGCAPESEAPVTRVAELLIAAGALERAEAWLGEHPSARGARARLRLAIARGDTAAIAEALAAVEAPTRAELRAAAESAVRAGDAVFGAELVAKLGAEDAALRVRALAAGPRGALEEALTSVDPRALGGLAAASRLYLRAGRPERAAELAAAGVLAGEGSEANAALADAELARGRYAAAATAAARAGPAGSATLRAALTAAGLGGLAREASGD